MKRGVTWRFEPLKRAATIAAAAAAAVGAPECKRIMASVIDYKDTYVAT